MRVRKEKNSLLVLSLLLIVLGIFSVPEARSDSGFGYRMKITVDHTKVSSSGSGQSNFPFLFSNTNNTTSKTNLLAHVTSASGYDIIFRGLTDAVCGTGQSPCTLNHEIEKWDPTSGEFVAWVNLPSVSTSADTVFYIYYGNSGILTSQEHANAVWDTNYKGVWHLPLGKATFTDTTQGGKPWTVPPGVTSVTVKAWGGGGGGTGATGGGGGFATGTITVTPGESLTVYVGGGGGAGGSTGSNAGGSNGGGAGGTAAGSCNGTTPCGAGGGGYSAVTRGATYLIQAGGGGGSSVGSYAGGAGGGSSGVAGSGSAGGFGGNPGTQSAGGTGANGGGSGTPNQGGTGHYGGQTHIGGGGGGGQYGGAGGGGSSTNQGGGGGSSDLIIGTATNPDQEQGSGKYPGHSGAGGRTSDPDYTGSYGYGGTAGGNVGNAGYVVITSGGQDSTSNANNGTIIGSPTTATGQINGAGSFSGTSQHISSFGSVLSASGNSRTVCAWIKPQNTTTRMGIVGTRGGTGSANGWVLTLNRTTGGNLTYYDTGGGSIAEFPGGITASNWYHVCAAFNIAASSVTLYVNGSSIGTQNSFTGSTTGFNGVIGDEDDSFGTEFNGAIDEVEISNSVRDVGWIATEYNNQKLLDDGTTNGTGCAGSSGCFYKTDPQDTNPPTIITLSSFTVSPEGQNALISWQTKSEVDNLGFNLYRTAPDGTGSVKLNGALIPGLLSSAIGKDYTYVDTGAKAETTVCYMLEDIDLHERSTYHGPACAYAPAPGSTTTQDASLQGTAAGGGVGGGSSSGSASSGGTGSQALPGTLPSSTGAVTEVTMRSLSAIKGPEGVVIQWQTGYEVRNLGFHVYRDEGGRHIRINHDLLLGSALIAGTHTILRSGHAYDFFDPGSSGGTYYVEDVDLSGKRTLHGPVIAVAGILPEKKSRIFPMASPRKARRLLANVDFPGGNAPVMTQFTLAGIPALKLLIQKEGIYRVSFGQLSAAGFDTRRPKLLQLYVDGIEQPLKVTTTGIEFYATGIDTPFTDTRTYWLVNGITPGKRILQTAGGTSGTGPQSFPATVVLKPRSFYFPALLNGDASNFFGDLLYQSGTTLTLSAPHVTQGDASLTVRLQGVTDSHHSIQVRINGSFVGNMVFDGQTPQEQLFPLGRGQLTEGTNQVSFASSGEEDIAAVDTLVLTYSHTYAAEGDHLRFSAPAGSGITLSGFTKPTTIFDVTDTVTEVAGQIIKEGIRIRVPGKGTRTLLVVTDAAYMTPELTANTPSAWHAAHRADLVIITHEDFRDSLTPLVQQRKKQGLSVAVIDIEDLYDEFSYGQKTPLAIKAFLARTKPHYVLLAGGATYDPRNYLGRGALDFVPTKLIDTAMIETASDDWFVDFDSNGLPDIPIGRLPVTTAQEAAATIAKLIRYEQMSPSPKALYVADTADQVGDFEAAIRPMESLMSFVPEELFRSKLGTTTASLLITRLTEGVGLITYLGHGSLQLWDGDVLDTTIADTLTNTTYPFFLAMTCLNGYFIIPSIDSLASALVTDAAGAVGMVASSTLTAFPPQAVLGSTFLNHLSTGATVGEALLAAKRAVSDPDVQRSYLLFGDPSMKVRR